MFYAEPCEDKSLCSRKWWADFAYGIHMGWGDDLKRDTNKAPFFHGEIENTDENKFQQTIWAKGPLSILAEGLVTLPIAMLRNTLLSIAEYTQASI